MKQMSKQVARIFIKAEKFILFEIFFRIILPLPVIGGPPPTQFSGSVTQASVSASRSPLELPATTHVDQKPRPTPACDQ